MNEQINDCPDFSGDVTDSVASQQDFVNKNHNHADNVHSVEEVLSRTFPEVSYNTRERDFAARFELSESVPPVHESPSIPSKSNRHESSDEKVIEECASDEAPGDEYKDETEDDEDCDVYEDENSFDTSKEQSHHPFLKDTTNIESAGKCIKTTASYSAMLTGDTDKDKIVSQAVEQVSKKVVSAVTSQCEKVIRPSSTKHKDKDEQSSRKPAKINKFAAHIKHTVDVVGKLFSSPLLIKAVGIITIVILSIVMVIAVSSMVMSVFSSTSLKNSDKELTKTYLYITELDAKLSQKIQGFESSGIEFNYRGISTDPTSFTATTDIDSMLLYLDIRFDEYKLDDIKPEIDKIHSYLYQMTEYNPSGIKTVMLIQKTVNDFIDTDTNISSSDKERIEQLREIGIYTTRNEMLCPFPDGDFRRISKRYGWYINSNKALEKREFIELTGSSGTVTAASGDSLTIKDGDRELKYSSLSSINVLTDSSIDAGDAIGVSRGNIEISYRKNGTTLNPLFYIEGIASGATGD